ncbi:MAG: tol-pal system YbgF family protein, partial [Candidatus Kapaibacterium sp.]
FGRMMEQYPNSPKAAATEFKLGECYERLNVPRSARNAYERVVADYPNSEFRDRAEARLKVLR